MSTLIMPAKGAKVPPLSLPRFLHSQIQHSPFTGCIEVAASQRAANTFNEAVNALDIGGGVAPLDVFDVRDLPAIQRRAIDSATSTTGGPFKLTRPTTFAEYLYNKTSVMRAGATIIPGILGPSIIPKQTGAATAYWVAENPGVDTTQSNLVTTATVQLAFKTISALTSVSQAALFSAAMNPEDLTLDRIIKADLATVAGLALDLAALNGVGSATVPLGVLQNTNIGTLALGANGAALTLTDLAELERLIGAANADAPACSFVTNSKARKKLRTTFTNTNSGVPLWSDANTLIGYSALSSEQVPSNLTKGTTSACSAVVFGAFESMLIGLFGPGLEFIVDPFTKKSQAMVEIQVNIFCDVAVRHTAALYKSLDVVTT